MDINEKELKRILLESEPILFLGAGFSIGSKNNIGELPKGMVYAKIFLIHLLMIHLVRVIRKK